MIRGVNLKAWVALLAAAMAAAMVGALLVDETKPAHAGAFPGTNGKIAFDSDRDADHRSDIYSMNPDGSNQTNLSRSMGDISASYSANGRKIAFSSARDGNSEIYSMNANGTLQTRLTTNPASDQSPSYSPDGKKIAFESSRPDRQATTDYEIYTMNANGTGVKQLTSDSADDRNPAWSPGGKKIAFVSARLGGDQV